MNAVKTDLYPIGVTATFHEALPGQPRIKTVSQTLQGEDTYHIGEPVASQLEFSLPIQSAQVGAGMKWVVADQKGVSVENIGLAETPPRAVGEPGGGEGHMMDLFSVASLPPGNSQIVFALQAALKGPAIVTKTVNLSGTYF